MIEIVDLELVFDMIRAEDMVKREMSYFEIAFVFDIPIVDLLLPKEVFARVDVLYLPMVDALVWPMSTVELWPADHRA